MVLVSCHTNLDISFHEQWPTELPCCPRVGDQIESGWTWFGGVRLTLEVVKVRFKHTSKGTWRIDIELHLSKHHFSISQFEEWYKDIVD